MLTIRVSRPSDVEDIAAVHAACWQDVYAFMPPEVLKSRDYNFRLTQWKNWYAEKKFDQSEGLFVMEYGKRIVGFCMCKPNLDPDIPQAKGEYHAQYVLPQYRARGTGYQVLQVLTAYLLSQKCHPCVAGHFKTIQFGNGMNVWDLKKSSPVTALSIILQSLNMAFSIVTGRIAL